MKKNKKKHPFCYAPWIGLYTTGFGIDNEINASKMFSAPCCVWNGNKWNGNISKKNVSGYWKILQKKMLRHDINFLKKTCKECIQREELGLVSDRNTWLKFVIEQNQPLDKIALLDVRFSNLCNLKCITCNALSSSMIEKEENVKTILHTGIDDIYKLDLSNLKVLKILGGEPSIQKEAHDFMTYVATNYDTANILLCITTNGTNINQNWLNCLKKFKKVYISLSIDGTDKIFEYLRTNANWNKVKENIEILYDFSVKEHSNMKLEFHVTVSNVLAATIDKWLPWFCNQEIKANFYAAQGGQHCVSGLPQEFKKRMKIFLEEYDHYYKNDLLKILEINENKLNYIKWCKLVKAKDKIRNTDIKKVDPIFKEIFTLHQELG